MKPSSLRIPFRAIDVIPAEIDAPLDDANTGTVAPSSTALVTRRPVMSWRRTIDSSWNRHDLLAPQGFEA